MADVTKSLKDAWMKGMETVSDAANRLAVSTRQKVQEMNIENRRTEILKDFGKKAYALWQQGEVFPEELDALLNEMNQLDQKLNEIRAERASHAAVQETEKQDAPEDEEVVEADCGNEADACENAQDDRAAQDEVPVLQVEEDEAQAEPDATPEADAVPTIQVDE